MSTNSLSVYQYKKAYRYNSDSLFLYDFAKDFLNKDEKLKLLDVGAGSGILGLLAKRDFPFLDVSLLDIQEKNIHLCKKNAQTNSLDVQVLQGDFLRLSGGGYDFIISNPPYYNSRSQKSLNEHISISRYDENLPLESFIQKSYNILNAKGELCFCYDASRISLVFSILLKVGFGLKHVRFVHANPDITAHLVLVHVQKNSHSTCKIFPPLISQENGVYTKQANDIFKCLATQSVDEQ